MLKNDNVYIIIKNVEKIGWGVDFFVDMMYHF